MERLRRRWSTETSWDDLGGREAREGITVWRYQVGRPEREARPEVMKVVYAPGTVVEPHAHDVDYTEIILEGSETVGRTRKGPGDIRVVQAFTVYGPIIAGPEGTTKLQVFASEQARLVTPAEVAGR